MELNKKGETPCLLTTEIEKEKWVKKLGIKTTKYWSGTGIKIKEKVLKRIGVQ